VFPTCFIEYMEPAIGRDSSGVYERNGISCSVPKGPSAAAPPGSTRATWPSSRSRRQNVAALAEEVRAGKDVIVAQPTCAYVLKRDYPLYVGGADAELVAEHTFDPAEYLLRHHRSEEHSLDLDFPGARACPTRSRTTCPATSRHRTSA